MVRADTWISPYVQAWARAWATTLPELRGLFCDTEHEPFNSSGRLQAALSFTFGAEQI